jgi:hypothetical protein
MSTLFETHQREELTVTAEGTPPDSTLKEVLKKISEVLFRQRAYERWQNSLETRRHPTGQHELDYGRVLREREGQVDVRIDHTEGRGGKQSWETWVLGIVGTLIAAAIGGVVYELSDLKADMRAILVRQQMDHEQIKELRCSVYKVCTP